MSGMSEQLQEALNSLHPDIPDRPVTDVRETALVKFCKLIRNEIKTWKDHEDIYSDEVKNVHNAVIKYLGLDILETDSSVRVSFTLEKE